MKTNRLEAFSDGVIAIILTIMVLDLKAPHEPTLAAVLKLWPVFLSYVLSFLIIAIYWVNHHHLLQQAHKVTGCMLWANIHLLFWLSIIPFVTGYLGETRGHPLAVLLYAGVKLACSIAFFILRAQIARNEGEMAHNREMQRKNVAGILIYLAAVLTAYLCVPLSLGLVALPALMYFMPDRSTEALADD